LAGVLAILLSGSTEAKTGSGIHQDFLKTKLEAVKGSAESLHRANERELQPGIAPMHGRQYSLRRGYRSSG